MQRSHRDHSQTSKIDEIRVEISTLKTPYEYNLILTYLGLTIVFNKDDACLLFETLLSLAFLIS